MSETNNSCDCPCHYTPGMMHCVPCCGPGSDESLYPAEDPLVVQQREAELAAFLQLKKKK